MSERVNVLLITVDSLRADHLGCYGYHWPTSPRIDDLAAEGALAERMICSSIPTHPSYTTMYTGQHAMTHNIVAHAGRNALSRWAPFLSEFFMEEGYTTCALDNLMRTRMWFGRGYEFYIDSSINRPLVVNVSAGDISRRAVQWLRQHRDETPFFMFLHYWDPHYPFTPPGEYRHLFYQGSEPADPDNHSLEAWWKHPFGVAAKMTWLRTANGHITDADYVRALYDQEIRYLDDGISELLDVVAELGLVDNTLVLFIADHGESMTEHGIFFEHHGLYDTVLHIPFMARLPGRIPAGLRLPHMFQTQDLAPTVLEAAGLTAPEEMEGRSMWKLLTGEEREGGYDRVISLESSWQLKWSLRTSDHKFILAREPDLYGTPLRELYHLAADPGEEKNLAEAEPALVSRMEQELEAWIAERLEALGKDQDPIVQHGISLMEGHPRVMDQLWAGAQ